MRASITRAQVLSRSAKGGAALLVGGSALGALVAEAAAEPLPTADLDTARLLVGIELLASDFYSRAIKAAKTDRRVTSFVKRASANERDHYRALSVILTRAGVTPAGPDDFDFTYADGTFASKRAIVKFAEMLEATTLGAYLTALGTTENSALRAPMALIAACEAQHSAYFTTAAGGKPFGRSFPRALPIDQVAKMLNLDVG